MNSFIEEHIKETRKFIEALDKKEIARWLLNEGYFPEQNVLPPCFRVTDAKLDNLLHLNLIELKKQKQIKIDYPKSNLTSRVFSVQHPDYYHDIVFHLIENWEEIIKILFSDNIKIYSYSFPIPIDTSNLGTVGTLRAGRLIYEWITMAEKDLIIEAYKYNFIVKSDITNFYNSVYTHSIVWALHGVEKAFDDKKDMKLFGTKIDKLFQYSNDTRTNGIPIGSSLSDLIAEVILSEIDLQSSKKIDLLGIKFIATRFKDDYRFLCESEEDAKQILIVLRDELEKFNLLINESKTSIEKLPQGLYRRHDREYYEISLKDLKKVPFKKFEITLLKVMDIHREYCGTSIIEKFLCELLDNSYQLKIEFTKKSKNIQYKEITKTFSLLLLLKRESPKSLCHILSIFESIFIRFHKQYPNLKRDIKTIINVELIKANKSKSAYEMVWYIYFSKYMTLGLNYGEITNRLDKDISNNLFLSSILSCKQEFFKDASKIKLFVNPKESVKKNLAKTLAVFNND